VLEASIEDFSRSRPAMVGGPLGAAFDRDFLEFATRGESDGRAEYPYEYLLVVARKRGH
jgi:hypothetical protein